MLKIFITGLDNGYIIEKWHPDMVGIPETKRIAVDTVDIFRQLALILDVDANDIAELFEPID